MKTRTSLALGVAIASAGTLARHSQTAADAFHSGHQARALE